MDGPLLSRGVDIALSPFRSASLPPHTSVKRILRRRRNSVRGDPSREPEDKSDSSVFPARDARDIITSPLREEKFGSGEFFQESKKFSFFFFFRRNSLESYLSLTLSLLQGSIYFFVYFGDWRN